MLSITNYNSLFLAVALINQNCLGNFTLNSSLNRECSLKLIDVIEPNKIKDSILEIFYVSGINSRPLLIFLINPPFY